MTIPKYVDLVASGLPLAGEVPRHWRKTALKYLGEYQNGYPFKPEDWGDVGLPIVRIAQLSGQGEPNYFSGTLDERVRVDDGDLLFSWSATIDSFMWSGGPAWLNQHIFKVTPSQEAEKPFLFYVIKHVAPKLADFDAHGSTMRHIKKESLGERLFVPDKIEQSQIAKFLDQETAKIDALVEEQKRLIELLREKREAVFSQAVTKGLNPSTQMKESGAEWLGKVPAHWQTTRLAHLFKDTDERGIDELPVLTVSIHDGVSDDELNESESDRKVTRSDDRTKYKRVQPGDLVYNMMRAWQGGFGSVTVHGMVSPAYVVARPRTVFPTSYVEGVLRTRNAIEEMRGRSRGVTDFRLRLYWEEFREIVIPVPPKDEVEAILERLQKTASETSDTIEAAEACIAILQERRSALISAAVTGKIDVRNH